jgi:hypothetical protein
MNKLALEQKCFLINMVHFKFEIPHFALFISKFSQFPIHFCTPDIYDKLHVTVSFPFPTKYELSSRTK